MYLTALFLLAGMRIWHRRPLLVNCKMAAAAGAPLPPPSLSDDDEPDYGTLPPKSLERLFGVDIVVANPDEPGDGIFHVIRDRKGKTLYLKNPSTNRWLRALGPTAQRLVDEAQNGAVVAPKRKRKIDEEQEDVGEASARIVSARKREEEPPLPVKNRVARKKDARKHWKVAFESVRSSLRLHKQKQSASTGLSLDFDSMDI